NKPLINILVALLLFILGIWSFDMFFDISIKLVKSVQVVIYRFNFWEGRTTYATAFALIPLIVLLIIRIKQRSDLKTAMFVSLIVGFVGILGWLFGIWETQQKYRSIDDEIRLIVDHTVFQFENYFLAGIVLGGLLSFLMIKKAGSK